MALREGSAREGEAAVAAMYLSCYLSTTCPVQAMKLALRYFS